MKPEHLLKLQQLHDELLAEGCLLFYIEGVGGPQSDGLDGLFFKNGKYEVSYTERGQIFPAVFSSENIEEAIDYYRAHILKIEHWHLVVITQQPELALKYKLRLEESGIKTIENNSTGHLQGVVLYRIFVVNKDIFKAREFFGNTPIENY